MLNLSWFGVFFPSRCSSSMRPSFECIGLLGLALFANELMVSTKGDNWKQEF